jgi:hypothetical protein
MMKGALSFLGSGVSLESTFFADEAGMLRSVRPPVQ